MIHYHGLPITGERDNAALAAIEGGHAFLSYKHRQQTGLAIEMCQSFAVDNGAFSAWRSGSPVIDWTEFFKWAEEMSYLPNCDFIVIPDVIDGDLNAQTALIGAFLQYFGCRGMQVGAPVFHLHEPLHHASYLARTWPRVCIGSSGEYAQVGSDKWERRMVEVMNAMTDDFGRPLCKIHGLRMLNPKVFTRFPFASADSTNIGRNVGIDKAWKGPYPPASKSARAFVMRGRIEKYQSPAVWEEKANLGYLI